MTVLFKLDLLFSLQFILFLFDKHSNVLSLLPNLNCSLFIMLFISEWDSKRWSITFLNSLSKTLMVFSILQRRCHPPTLVTNRAGNVFFTWEGQNTNIKKRSILFRLHILSACFWNQKQFSNTVLIVMLQTM